jgi:hypothetical protein
MRSTPASRQAQLEWDVFPGWSEVEAAGADGRSVAGQSGCWEVSLLPVEDGCRAPRLHCLLQSARCRQDVTEVHIEVGPKVEQRGGDQFDGRLDERNGLRNLTAGGMNERSRRPPRTMGPSRPRRAAQAGLA